MYQLHTFLKKLKRHKYHENTCTSLTYSLIHSLTCSLGYGYDGNSQGTKAEKVDAKGKSCNRLLFYGSRVNRPR